MDFIRVAWKDEKDGTKTFYPSLQALESTDLVIRGGQFAAIWDEETGLYNRNQSHLPDILDRAFFKMVGDRLRTGDTIKKFRVYENQLFTKLLGLIRNIGDMGPELDQTIVFADQAPSKKDAASFRMPYSLSDAPAPVWNEIVGTLYDPEQRQKIEYAIGSIFTGAASTIVQKFYVFYGPPGSGKSTVMNVMEQLFEGHTAAFSAYDLGKADAAFSLEPFALNPLVALDQDGDLSRIEVNKNLNSIVSHDRVLINSKGKNLFKIIPRSTLFVGTNDPVKISNRKSGLFRRLVDIQPSGNLLAEDHYHQLVSQVQFELGSIAQHCINVYNSLGPTYLSSYRSNEMMYRTNDIFNFVQDHRLVLDKGVTLKQAHKMYIAWCEETETRNVYKQFQFRDMLRDYFGEFHEQVMINGVRMRSYFDGLRELEKFDWKGSVPVPPKDWLELTETTSGWDGVFYDQPAQYATDQGVPKQAWSAVTTTLKDIDTSEEHFVKVPTQHIVIDFDLRDENGTKSLSRNLAAASRWPPTYAEVSRGGGGLHLHYDYDGDVERLANGDPDGDYEVKTLLGGASLRRRLSLCNTHKVATISSGLPLKEEKVLSQKVMSSEKGVRELIVRALNKDIHPGTKSNMDFIEKVLKDANDQGLVYDVTDMWDEIFAFAMSSSHQRARSLEIALGLKLQSDAEITNETIDTDRPIAYFDSEVYPNLYAIGWMYEDQASDEVTVIINPKPHEVEEIYEKLRLIGYNNRSYDDHIAYAAEMGADNAAIYDLSQRIVSGDRKAMYGAAYSKAYGDLFDFMSEKKTLKWWQVNLGLPHKEMDLPWDQPVPEDRMEDVVEYLKNDVRSTRALARARRGDLRARQILAQLSGLEVINTTRQHTERMIFGGKKDVQSELVYTDLHEMFPGYKFDRFASGKDKSTYRGESIGEGGLVRAKPGMYTNVALLDVASMHPTSIIELNLFGEYTSNFQELMEIRLLLKQGRLDEAGEAYGGRIKEFVESPEDAKMLSDALKIVINSVYGLTAASFPNLFKDPRNVDNIVAKRGALFMMDLKVMVEHEGFEVVHIKTDSVKIPNATPEIVAKVMDFGQHYGYTFEHEETYDKFCLVNDAVYVAGVKDPETGDINWSATGAEFQKPVVFKTLFSKEEIDARDYVEAKQVTKGAMYLVNTENGFKQFVGRFGAFIPVLGGRTLLRIDGEKEHHVTGTKGFLWETDDQALSEKMDVDMSYFQEQVDDAMRTIEKFGSYAEFTSP